MVRYITGVYVPLPLKMSMDFIEDGNMIQLKFNILGYLKKEAWLCEGSDAKHSATIQLLKMKFRYTYHSCYLWKRRRFLNWRHTDPEKSRFLKKCLNYNAEAPLQLNP